MPDAKNNAKQTGDTHLPEVESEQPRQEGMSDALGADGTPRDRGQSSESGEEGKPGRGINQAGLLKDKDAPTSDTYGNTRDSGETPDQGRS
jgi:hypothetical protein